MERLDKALVSTGRWSRREARELLKAGRVAVDGIVIRRGEEKIGESALMTVDGEILSHSRPTCIMLHKPAGLLSATEDRRQKTVVDLLPPELRKLGLFPVGRLDKDTEGLLLLTDDGALAHALLSPKKHVDKVYFVRVEGRLDRQDQDAFQKGMVLGDGTRCLPAELRLLADPGEGLVTLREGKYHQVKRRLAQRGKPVTYLNRLSMGPLSLDERLEKGAWRPLTSEEIAILWSNSTKNY